MINRTSGMPLYLQLADEIRNEIKSNKIKPGDKLMSEMVKHYQIGRLTVREALSVLVNEGVLEKQHGKGTFCIDGISGEKRSKFDLLLDMSDVYFIPFYLKSICDVFENENCDIVINDTKNDNRTICTLLSNIINQGSDGVIVQPCTFAAETSAEIEDVFSGLVRSGIPYIMIDGVYENVVQSYVVLDEKRVGAIAGDFFTERGHKNLCMIHNNKYKDSKVRMQGFQEKLDNQIALIDIEGNVEEELEHLISDRPDVTGILCYNDLAAKKCIDTLTKMSVKVPDKC